MATSPIFSCCSLQESPVANGSSTSARAENSSRRTSEKEIMPSIMPWQYDIYERKAAIMPWEQEILLLDLNKGILESSVSNMLGRCYLQPWIGAADWPAKGKIFGINHRLMISLATSMGFEKAEELQIEPVNTTVHYLIDTGAPNSFLCEDAVQALSPTKRFYYDEFTCIPVLVHGFRWEVHVSPSKSHFKDICILGSDILTAMHAKLVVDYGGAKDFTVNKEPNPWLPTTGEV